MPDDQDLEFQIALTAGDQSGATQAGAALDALNQKAGVDAPAAAAKSSNAFKDAFTDIKEVVHPAHMAVRLFEQTMGLFGIAIGIVTAAWELYQQNQDKTIEKTTNAITENNKLIDSLKGIKEAGGTLSDVDNALLISTEKLSKAQGATLVEALSKKRQALKDDIAETSEKISQDEIEIARLDKVGGSSEAVFGQMQKLTQTQREQTQSLDALNKQIHAVSNGYATSEAEIAADTKSTAANTAAKKAASDAAAALAKKLLEDQAKADEEALKAQIKVIEDETKAQVKGDDEKLKDKNISNAKMKTLYQDQATVQIQAVEKETALEIAALNKQHDQGLISTTQYNAKMIALVTTSDAKMVSLQTEADDKIVAADKKKTEALLKNIEDVESTGTQAFTKALAQGESLQQAGDAAASAMIKSAADAASKKLLIDGATAAGDAFEAAGNPYLGAVEAAGVFAWYAGLAGIVSAAGGAVSNAISPPAPPAGSSSSAAAATGTQTSTNTATTSPTTGVSTNTESNTVTDPATGISTTTKTVTTTDPITGKSTTQTTTSQTQKSAVGSAVTTMGPGANVAGANQGQTIIVNLDSQPILKAINQASNNGNLTINARSVV